MGYLTDGHRHGSSAGPGGARSSWYLAPGRRRANGFAMSCACRVARSIRGCVGFATFMAGLLNALRRAEAHRRSAQIARRSRQRGM